LVGSSDDDRHQKRHRECMVVRWKILIGAGVCDVVACRDTDQVYVAQASTRAGYPPAITGSSLG
jgi:hypothetical protein